MRWTYDCEVDALYVYLRDHSAVARQVAVQDRFVLDVSDEGDVVGLEVLDAGLPWSPVEIIGEAHLPPEDLRSLDFIATAWHMPTAWTRVARPDAQPALASAEPTPAYA